MEENPRVKNREADMAVSKAGCRRYLTELKAISEGRRDRLVPVLAQAILQAQAIAKASSKPAMPMAVVAAPRISAAVVSHLKHSATITRPMSPPDLRSARDCCNCVELALKS